MEHTSQSPMAAAQNATLASDPAPAHDDEVSADGHRPTHVELIRIGVGFTLSAIACAIP